MKKNTTSLRTNIFSNNIKPFTLLFCCLMLTTACSLKRVNIATTTEMTLKPIEGERPIGVPQKFLWQAPLLQGQFHYLRTGEIRPNDGQVISLFGASMTIPVSDDDLDSMQTINLWCHVVEAQKLLSVGLDGALNCYSDMDKDGKLDLRLSRELGRNEPYPYVSDVLSLAQPITPISLQRTDHTAQTYQLRLIALPPTALSKDVFELVLEIDNGRDIVQLNHTRKFITALDLPKAFDFEGARINVISLEQDGITAIIQEGFKEGSFYPFLIGFERFKNFVPYKPPEKE